MMSTKDIPSDKLITLCKDYVDNSNNHNVDLCLKDFDNDTEYISSSVGTYKGTTTIYSMMKGYFDKYPNVHWNVEAYTVSNQYQNAIEFDFVRTGCSNNEGQEVVAEGKECIVFKKQNNNRDDIKISKVIVDTITTKVIDGI
jgi:hypothetical protein